MGAQMRAHDWSSTPLGPPEAWPQSLRSTVSACLNSPLLGTILWGHDLRMLYNDSYIPSLADHHPGALGQPVSSVWGDAWEQVFPPLHHAMATGEGFSQTNVELPLFRNGKFETTYWDFTATPIRGEDGNGAIVRVQVSSNCSFDVSGISIEIARHLLYSRKPRDAARDGHDIKAVTVKVLMHPETGPLPVVAQR